MSEYSFYDEMRHKTEALWEAIFAHPFVQGIGDGTLSRDRYEFFLKQDYVYLIDFSRVFSLAAAKAPALEEMGYFATLLEATLNTEMALHRRTCEAFGISVGDLEKTEPALITLSYSNLLIRTCYEGTIRDILTVLLPCAAGYGEIGRKLRLKGLPEDPFYRDWIQTYAADEYTEFTDWLIHRANHHAAGITETEKTRLFRLYLSSARFEYLFFDMSWKREGWKV